MTLSTFRYFPKLPSELRLHIWKLAVRHYDDNRNGLHYFLKSGDNKLDPSPAVLCSYSLDSDVASYQDFPASTSHSATIGNRSAFMWDTGLWTACRESREVMVGHYERCGWGEVNLGHPRGAELDWSSIANADMFDTSCSPPYELSRTSIELNGKWAALRLPSQDIFCIRPEDWNYMASRSDLFPFTYFCKDHKPFYQIAVEFDPTWNFNLPDNHIDMMSGSSPPAFAAELVSMCIKDGKYSDDADFCIWLIDRNANGNLAVQEKPRQVVHDCDYEYIKMETCQYKLGHDFSDYGSLTAGYFIQQLASRCDHIYAAKVQRWNQGYRGILPFSVADHMGVLSCRETSVRPY
ncbi:hypothetical protein NM208_g1024 [Fusarium decemcellulare]|uniref:Uncharacterized protein n=1 Tax=Fusarium decemcellulare TaxID=57161 RepID=A0ACC1SXV5_9HYPO|nr:hypothetical protein NM208_g1024 [Fusarium decemcellulare]